MNSKKAVFLDIAISVFFALAIIISDFLLEGTQYGQIAMYILIAMWFIPFVYLTTAAVKEDK
ncbi:hypothetical protein [Methanolobus bombayensis]|uniref:hypothetical protein n=1 Tax=Methanolobus bombayensis TaxID=38023 RepID=UPI001AE2A4CC|nr:hypothetical protein [Methanolobus bombayensis]MBP1908514.1 ABC-type bacteriocin/lantibiotic exporter with double-glycine peptidase domain [Methanolobus bombayensis]